MDAGQVLEKILADAKNQADSIGQEAEKQRTAEQAGFDAQMEEYKKQTEVLVQKSAAEKKSHLLAAARMDIAKELLAEKRKLLDEVFQQAQSQMQNLPDEDYRSLMTKLMLEAVETGDEEIIVDKNETRINQEFIDKVNLELSSNSKGNLKLSDERYDIGGGFVLRRGKIKNNISFDILLTQARKELEIDLAKELFS